MKKTENRIKCDGKNCRVSLLKARSLSRWEMIKMDWSFVQVNLGHVLIFCPRHLVSVEVKRRGR